MAAVLYYLTALLLLTGPSVAQIAPTVIVFGDSTVDTGNNDHINTTLDFRANFLPYGQQFFGKPSGRFCNGKVFVDYICDFLGVPHVPPYLQPDADFSKGVNFGSGGAGVLAETNGGLTIPLGTQLKYFGEFEEALVEKWGSVQAEKYLSDAIYFVSIANNDYMAGYFSVAELREKHTPQEFVALIVGEIIRACEFVHSKGGRKFVIVEAGPLGCVPALRQFDPNQGCFQPAQDLGVAHNGALTMALKAWQAGHADVTLLLAGLYQFMMDRITNPTAFGFKEGVAACCGTGSPGAPGNQCGGQNPVTGEKYGFCENPEDYVFWDMYHGSQKMHEEFAKDMWSGNGGVISPLSLRQLVDLSSSDCDAELPVGYSSGPASIVDAPIEHSSF